MRTDLRWCWKFCIVIFLWPATASAQNEALIELGQRITEGEAFQKQGKHQAAVDAYARAETLAAGIFGPTHVNVAAMTQAQGLLYREMGQFERARTTIARALKIARISGDLAMVAEAVNNLANAEWDLGNFLIAQELYEESFQRLRTEHGDDSPSVAISRGNLAGIYKSLGQYSRAEPFYLRSIQVLQAHQDTHALNLADALMNLAGLYSLQGEPFRAEPLLTRSIAIKERAMGANHYEVGRTLNNLAAIYVGLGQYEKAEKTYLRSLQIIKAGLGEEHIDVARGQLNLAGLYQRSKQYAKAEAAYQVALALREKNLGKDHPDVGLTLHNMSGLYMLMGNFPKADEGYQRTLRIRESRLGKDHPETATTLTAIARLRYEQKRYDDAEKLYERALEIRRKKLPENHPDLAIAYNGLALLALTTQRWDEAGRNFDLARRVFRRYADQVLPTLPEPDQLTFLREIDEAEYHAALSLVLQRPGDPKVAELSAGWVINGKAIVQQTMAQRVLMSRDNGNPLMATIVQHLLALRKQLASLSFIGGEGAQAAAQREKLAGLSRQEQDQSQQLAALGGRPAGGSAWVELEKVRGALAADTVLIEIARFRVTDYQALSKDRSELPERYVAWIIPAAGQGAIKVVDLGDAAAIDTSVKAARAALQSAPAQIHEKGDPEAEQELLPVLKTLAKQILAPLVALAGDVTQVHLSPDSILWLVPWSALPLESGEYAIEKYDFRFLVSGRDLLKNETKFISGPSVLFADPNYDLAPADVQAATQRLFQGTNGGSGTFKATSAGSFKLGTVSRLPGTRAEAKAVLPKMESYAGSKVTVYTDQYALEAVFKVLRQPRIVVLSTHGFFESDAPAAAEGGLGTRSAGTAAPPQAPGNPLLRCGLLLAGCNQPVDTTQGEGEDGILTGLEIVGTDLRGTELVVLSACETGLGVVRNGEGVAGLRQAFQLAGAQAVVSTLWQIPDRETARLMSDFFGGLADTGLKAKSLRDAQLNQIKARRERQGAAHPFFWAAFTLTGD